MVLIFINSVSVLLIFGLVLKTISGRHFNPLKIFRLSGLISLALFLLSLNLLRSGFMTTIGEKSLVISFSTLSISLFVLSFSEFISEYIPRLKKWLIYIVGFVALMTGFVICSIFFDLEFLQPVANSQLEQVIVFTKLGKYFIFLNVLNIVLVIYYLEEIYYTF